MLAHPVTARQAWQHDTVDAPAQWRRRLSERVLAALDQALIDWRKSACPVTELSIANGPLADCAAELQPALEDLENGRGFVILQGPAADRYRPEELQACYWLIGQLLGRPFAQNVQGTLLYDVKDTGQDVRYGARFSVTNAESTFHTDNSFGEDVLDYVGLLCLNTARSGGLSQVLSAYALHNRLLAEHREALEVLYQPFHVDRRGGVRPGETPTVQFPVFSWNGRELLCRYLRYWIEVGQDKAGLPLTAGQKHVFDVLDHVAADPALRVDFALEPGDMYFINNRWILHNRTAFDDHPEPERKRHLVRLWLQRR
jgi:alpha-ketoglutarate-dependent taurine dioxygenase